MEKLEKIANEVKEILDNSKRKVVEVKGLSEEDADTLRADYFEEYNVLGVTKIFLNEVVNSKNPEYTLHISNYGRSKNV